MSCYFKRLDVVCKIVFRLNIKTSDLAFPPWPLPTAAALTPSSLQLDSTTPFTFIPGTGISFVFLHISFVSVCPSGSSYQSSPYRDSTWPIPHPSDLSSKIISVELLSCPSQWSSSPLAVLPGFLQTLPPASRSMPRQGRVTACFVHALSPLLP